jgi:hypothetical protein
MKRIVRITLLALFAALLVVRFTQQTASAREAACGCKRPFEACSSTDECDQSYVQVCDEGRCVPISETAK